MSLRDYIRAMPKVELHVHLEGTVQPATLLELARANGVPLPATDIEGLREWYTFRDFDHFLDVYMQICACLKTPGDFTRITYEYGRAMAAQNIRYAEVTWTPATHVSDELPFEALLEGINAGRVRAEQTWGVQMQWVPDIARCFPATAEPVVEWLTSPAAQAGDVVALGLGGPEIGWPPELFENAFDAARAKGLHSNPHAGETVGPESIWGAIRSLKAERVGHGVRAIEDPELVRYIAEHQIHLEVNPTSNLCLNIYPSYAEHPLRALVDAGVNVSINSDDPALFNTTLTDEYIHAVEDCGLSIQALERSIVDAIQASYLPSIEKSKMTEAFRAEFAHLRPS